MFWQLLKLIFANFRNSNFAYFRKFPLLKPIKELATLDILIGFNLGNAKFSFLIGKNSFSQLPKQNWLVLARINATKNHFLCFLCFFVCLLFQMKILVLRNVDNLMLHWLLSMGPYLPFWLEIKMWLLYWLLIYDTDYCVFIFVTTQTIVENRVLLSIRSTTKWLVVSRT